MNYNKASLLPASNATLRYLYSDPNVIQSPNKMRWAGHVALMGEERGRIGSWWGHRRERDHW